MKERYFEGIKSHQLKNTPIDKIEDRTVYQLGFARKTLFNISHSSIALIEENGETNESWLILGRQSKYFYIHQDPDKNFARYFKIWEFFKTRVDNEKYYNFFKDIPFNIQMSTARFSGVEIKEIVREANRLVCEPQPYNVLISNCYSASIVMMTHALKILYQKRKEETKEQIASIATLLDKATQDHFSIGVCNNSVVGEALRDTRILLKKP